MAKKASDQISEHVVVLYEPGSGKVRHLHHSIAAPGAELPSDAVLEKEALELASRLHGLTAEIVNALHVDATELKSGSRHRVDVKTKRLVTEPLTREKK